MGWMAPSRHRRAKLVFITLIGGAAAWPLGAHEDHP
jgi:hypothetical protein